MEKASTVLFIVALLYASTDPHVQCLDRIDLYPFGTVQGDRRLPVGDDVSSNEIHLKTAIAFYDNIYTELYINLNGLLSFDTEVPAYRSNMILPLGYPVIAPFFADVDINLSGNVYYRETQDPTLLKKAEHGIRKAFSRQDGFYPESLFIVTWDDVGAYRNQFQPTNTFQVVIASDGDDSFVTFLYPDDGLNWIQGDGKDAPRHPDVPAQVGFDSGENGRYYTLPGSGNSAVSRLASTSNFGVNGAWLFHIGDTNRENIQTPETASLGGEAAGDIHGNTCAGGGQRTCDANARCVDYPSGFCCACNPPYIGNGRECIAKDEPQRLSGKVTGYINGEYIDGVDLHAYVVTTEGRTYTAISRIPSSIGYSLQSMYSVGSGLGFLFAMPQSADAKNGFMLTGGEFNRSATIQFEATGDRVTINQAFTGQDAQDNMRMTTNINGQVPVISERAKVEVEDYREEYRRVAPGVFRSQSIQTLLVDGTPYKVNIDQTINFMECSGLPLDPGTSVILDVNRNFVVYTDHEQIGRYSQTNKIPGDDTERPPVQDVCRYARCDQNADCIQDRDSYRCVCREGYQGDGLQCREETCDVRQNCHQQASCEYDYSTGAYRCQCNQGYTGDGYRCERVDARDCSVDPGICDRNARCEYDYQRQTYACLCNEGFTGDGSYCTPERGDRVTSRPPVRDRTSYLMYAQGMYIMEVAFNSRSQDDGKLILYIPGQTAIGIDTDCQQRYFYWTDVSGKTISRARLDGTDSNVIVRDLGSPEGVAVDWLSGNIYWTDSGLDRIEMSKLDGTYRKTLFSTDLVNPRAIAVDPIRGVLFWTDWNRDAPKIEKSNMDGTERTVLVSDGLGLPNALTVDFDSYNICWGDAGSRKVECVNYDGRNRRILSQSAGYPFGIVYNDNVFYWTDWERSTLPNINKNSDRPNEDLILPIGANGHLYGITAVRNYCPSGSNPCAHDNGGCRYLCTPGARGERTCTCPNDVSPLECSRSLLL